MITGATLHKVRLFNSPQKLTFVQDTLLGVLSDFGWQIQAWAVLANHYHVVGLCTDGPERLSATVAKVHGVTARAVNRLDGATGRQVWYQSWDTQLTYRRSYFARLRYVHENAVHHRLVPRAAEYDWCSAGWLEQRADPAYRKMLESFPIDNLSVKDDFD